MKEIRDLIDYLNARTAEYDAGHPTVSDKEWDDKYFKLQELERVNCFRYPDSPTQSISYTTVSSLNKVKHSHPMLSLPKTKVFEEAFRTDMGYVAMPKMDGLTCSLRYEDGELVAAETRGNGEIGEDILHNAKVVKNIPQHIKMSGTLVVDGEIICKLDDFKAFADEYKNPRNFAAGSIRLLDSKECARRNLSFIAWDVIEGLDSMGYLTPQLDALHSMGFETVFAIPVTEEFLPYIKNLVTDRAHDWGFPIDGIVLKVNDIQKRKSYASTAHHLGGAIAFKFYDEEYDTVLRDIDWTMGRTGELTPVAVFDAVDADGSVIERASVHNLSVMSETFHGAPYRGQKIKVCKMNEIIPQVTWTEDGLDVEEIKLLKPIKECPICGDATFVNTSDSGVRTLFCGNPACSGKLINRLDHFCGKKGLDIKGLSTATLEKLCAWGWVNQLSDIFTLCEHKVEWQAKPGFGVKSVSNILDAIDGAKASWQTDKFIAALGIPLVGSTLAKEICKKEHDWAMFRDDVTDAYKFSFWDGFGPEIENAILNFNYDEADAVWRIIQDGEVNPYSPFDKTNSSINEMPLSDLTFVITGKLSIYKNRNELKAEIEKLGGKTTDSVSKNTSYLINNDTTSGSSKNVAAQKLGIPIISEADFVEKWVKK